MAREVQEPTLDEYGAETHPAFGMVGASRVSSTPGAILFDSDIRHGHYVVLRISRATRRRDLKHDWIHGGSRELIEVAMSEAQWASFVSSMNTAGVPCTIVQTETEFQVPGLNFSPRLKESMREVHEAATEAFDEILEALAALEALEAEDKPSVKARREALHTLKMRIKNATPNVDYAGKKLAEHAENVVQKARADIEAMVTHKAAQLGLTGADAQGLLSLEVGEGGTS